MVYARYGNEVVVGINVTIPVSSEFGDKSQICIRFFRDKVATADRIIFDYPHYPTTLYIYIFQWVIESSLFVLLLLSVSKLVPINYDCGILTNLGHYP